MHQNVKSLWFFTQTCTHMDYRTIETGSNGCSYLTLRRSCECYMLMGEEYRKIIKLMMELKLNDIDIYKRLP